MGIYIKLILLKNCNGSKWQLEYKFHIVENDVCYIYLCWQNIWTTIVQVLIYIFVPNIICRVYPYAHEF